MPNIGKTAFLKGPPQREKVVDGVIVLFIALVGLLTAYVTFGVLKSQAEGEFQGYQLGGAIAGAIVSWSMLASVYLQIRKSSGELQELRERNEELQQKLIRGTPRPPGFEIELAEQQKLVLARPKEWERRGGIIFDFVLPDERLQAKDNFPARFLCSFIPIPKRSADPKQSKEIKSCTDYYEKYLMTFAGHPYIQSYTSEYISIGGDPQHTESLKIIAHQYVRIFSEKDPITSKETRNWKFIGKDAFESAVDNMKEV
ncbi:MAG: hypothetical protein WAM70_18910, partial [Pyrinomonadaceae bacterium]